MNVIRYILILMLVLAIPATASAQAVTAQPPLPPDQLDQMVAPIALYPDPLIAQILMASTYPLEIVEAYRWQQNPANAGLQGDQLAAALEQQPWDPSVKSLVPFPQVLQTLNQNIEWTEQLGDAFLAQQADVMNAIQNLRIRAQQAGTLQSTPQQVVTDQGSVISIQPANPDIVYVPAYNPETVYGDWAYPDYPPYYFSGYDYAGIGLGFAVGIAVLEPLWGWTHWDWRDHRIDIDNARYARLNQGRPAPASGYWQHDAAHRHGVPYANPTVRAQFAPNGNRPEFRGYEPHAAPVAAPTFTHTQAAPAMAPRIEPQIRSPATQPARSESYTAPAVRPAPSPVFESFARGPQVQQQQQRGAQSRAAAAPAGHSGGSVEERR